MKAQHLKKLLSFIMSLENISEDFLHSSQLDCEIGSYLGVFLML